MKPAFYWNILAFFMWGVFILGLRYALERRRQLAEQRAVQAALDTALGSSGFTPLAEAHHAL
jgi:heme exporter protein C